MSSAPVEQSLPASRVAGVGVAELVRVSAISAAAALSFYHLWVLPDVLPRIATVDLAAIYREQEGAFARAVGREGASDAERDAAFRRAEAFARALPEALDELAAECGCTVLASNAVAGGPALADLTPTLRARLFGR